MLFRKVAVPRSQPPSTVHSAETGLLLGLNDQAVATIIAFGTGGLYAMFTVTTGVGLYTRLTGRWNPALGRWGLPINVIAFHRSIFEFINIAWPPPLCVVARRALAATLGVPLVLGSIVSLTALHVLFSTIRKPALPESSS